MRAGIGIALAAATLFASCTSTSDPFSTTTSGTSPPDAGGEVTAEVTASGATITTEGGATVVIPAGSLPAGTVVTVASAAADPARLPAAATATGAGVDITATASPSAPILVEIPVPPGESAEDLYLLHLLDDGSYTYIGGAVEDGAFVSALPSFSEALLVHLQLSQLLDLPSALELPTLVDDSPMPALPASAEAAQIALGHMEASDAFHRAVRILGPGGLAPGVDGVFQADDFEARRPEFVTYEWFVYPASGLVLESTQWEAARFTAVEPGDYTIIVEARDPTTGATAQAARRVRVTDEALVAWAVPDADGYCCGETPVVTLGVSGGEPPITVEWALDSGAATSEVIEAVPWETAVTLPPATHGGLLQVTATDSTGDTSTSIVPLPERLRGPLGMITGPLRVPAGENAEFSLVTTPDIEPERLVWVVYPRAEITGGNTFARVVWGEPGVGRLRVFYESPTQGLMRIDDLVIGIFGPAEPVQARIADGPEQLAVGEEGVWRLRAKGGVVAPADGFRGYVAIVDFGDGTVLPGVEMPAETATRLCPYVEVSHSYQEPGQWQVTVTLVDSAGTIAEAAQAVTVTEAARLVADGEFIVTTLVPVEVVENEIRIVIDNGRVRFPRFAWYTIVPYVGFDLAGGTSEATCHNHSRWDLLSLEAAYDPATGAITGTAVMLWDRLDVGTDCPFGGMDAEQERTMALEATLADGVIEGTFMEADDLLPEGVGLGFTATLSD